MARLDVEALCKLRSPLLLKKFHGGITPEEQEQVDSINRQLEREFRDLPSDRVYLRKLVQQAERAARRVSNLAKRAKAYKARM